MRPSRSRVVTWPAQRLAMRDRAQLLFVAGTLLCCAHTVDEVRTGQLVALPFAIVNLAVVFGWAGIRTSRRAALAVAFGLMWIVTVVPYHVVPLLHGAVTWQNVSGLSRVAGGVVLLAAAVTTIRQR